MYLFICNIHTHIHVKGIVMNTYVSITQFKTLLMAHLISSTCISLLLAPVILNYILVSCIILSIQNVYQKITFF